MDGKRKRKDHDHVEGSSRKHQQMGPRDAAGFTSVELRHGQALVFAGTASLDVRHGSVDVAGFVATATNTPIELSVDLKTCGAISIHVAPSNAARAPQRAHAGSGAAAVVHVAPLVASKGQDTAALQAGDGYKLWLDGAEAAPQPAAPPREWLQAVASLSEASAAVASTPGAAPLAVVMCGSKGTGKSTLARLLANRLLSQHGRVAFLDTDCGQPEMTPPGLVSLHVLDAPLLAAPHHHQRMPALAFFQGDTSPQTDPQRYMRSIAALHAWYCTHAGDEGGWPPLVVNTHGWVSGLGLDLLAELLRCVGSTHVITLQTSSSKKNLPSGHFWLDPAEPPLCQLICLPALATAGAAIGGGGGGGAASGPASSSVRRPAASADLPSQASSFTSGDGLGVGGSSRDAAAAAGTRSMSAVEARALQWLAWARRAGGLPPQRAMATPDDADTFGEVAGALTEAAPYEVCLDDVEVQLLFAEVPREQQLVVLNAAVVGLAVAAPSVGGARGGGAAPRPCLGLGLVRAVDGAARRLYVLTDVPPSELERVQVLQVGRLELPLALLQTQQLASPYQALFCLASDSSGAGPIKSRNNLLRVGLLSKV